MRWKLKTNSAALRKVEMAEKIAKLLANGDKREESMIYHHQMNRTIEQVRESYNRTLAIESVTPAEAARHCQFDRNWK